MVKKRNWLTREHFLDLPAAVNIVPGGTGGRRVNPEKRRQASGAAPVLMRRRRILKTCWGPVMTGLSQRWRAAVGSDEDPHLATAAGTAQGVLAVRCAATLSARKCACRARAAAYEAESVHLCEQVWAGGPSATPLEPGRTV